MESSTPETERPPLPSPLARPERFNYPPPPDPVYSRLTWLLALILALLAMRVLVPYFAEHLQYAMTRGRQRAEVEVAAAALQGMPLEQLSHACQMVSKRVGPSVVHIHVSSLSDVPMDEFSALYGPRVRRGEGSGVIVDPEGYVLTNNHVVRGARRIRVVLSDGRNVSARVLGTDAPTDLAVLKLDAGELTAAEWGDSEALEVGSLVWAVGSPFGLQQTITFGILSAKNRTGLSESPYLDFLQTDAAVNPGNSGGPLVDARGQVVGINTAILGDAYQGISFAIPSSVARRVFERIKLRGHVDRGWLGVQLVDVDSAVASQLQLDVQAGALVTHLSSASGLPSPAAQAGIRPGDVIVRWDGQPIQDALTLQRRVALMPPGAEAEVMLLRRGEEVTLTVTLGERPAVLR